MKIALILSSYGLCAETEEFDTRDLAVDFELKSKIHDKCEELPGDFECKIDDDFQYCWAPCEHRQDLVLKRKCECLNEIMPSVVIYSPNHCTWKTFEDQCFSDVLDVEPPENWNITTTTTTSTSSTSSIVSTTPMSSLEGSGVEDTEVTTETTSNPKFKWKIDGPSGHGSRRDRLMDFVKSLGTFEGLTIIQIESGTTHPK